MKKLLLLLLPLLAVCLLSGFSTGKSILFADSFMLRAQGTEALYYNPALLNESYSDIMLPVVNTAAFVANNSFDLDTYNYIMRSDYLDDEDKAMILNKIDNKLQADTEVHMSVFGYTVGNLGLGSSLHLYARSMFSKKYLELLLYGNQDSLYVFDQKENDLSLLSFGDITFGMGDLKIGPKEKPWVKLGFSGSLLIGIEDINTKSYSGSFSSGYDGLSFAQDIVLDTGLLGLGFKGMLGAVAEPMPNLSVGVTLDNILGSIGWFGNTEAVHYKVEADSLFIANLEDDFFTETDERIDIDNYSTTLPLELRLAALYKLPFVSVSVDWVQPFESSVVSSGIGQLSLGAEFNPFKYFPIDMGLAFGNSDQPMRMALGLGIRTSYGDIGLGFQSFDYLLPGYNSKGISIGSYWNFKL